MMDYRSFLASKSQLTGDHGFAALWLPDFLFDFQRHLVEWALRKGRAAIFADTGLGKTAMELVWAENVARKTGRPALILTPLAVSFQTVREAEKFGIEARRSTGGDPSARIVVTNFERLDRFNPDDYAGVVVDECFPAGTLIDTPCGQCNIEDVQPGDVVLNAAGTGVVKKVHKRKVAHAVRVSVEGAGIVSSPDHLFFTQRGWVRASSLRAGDYALATGAAVSLVRDLLPPEVFGVLQSEVLRNDLLREMEDEYAGAQGEGPYARSGGATRQSEKGTRRAEGCQAWLARVDCVEVLEPGLPELDRYRDAAGQLYFYDLAVSRHPSYSVNGLLVHNCSIVKHWSGATQKALTRFLSKLPYRLLCTATPAPNDYVEMGTLSEALGEMTYTDMLAVFFRQLTDDEKKRRATPGDVISSRRLSWRVIQSFGQWAMKSHAFEPFWRWVSSWARACRKPSDVGAFADDRYVLPPLVRRDHVVTPSSPPPGYLFTLPAFGLNQERAERRRTLDERADLVVRLTKDSDCAVVWCHLNDEADRIERDVAGAVQVKGGQSVEMKEDLLLRFLNGEARVLVTKPKVAGFGLNLQHCAHVVTFVTHSFEQHYQCVRRCWRFGQKRPVTLDVIATEGEVNVKKNMDRKEQLSMAMFDNVVRFMNDAQTVRTDDRNVPVEVPQWLSRIK